MTERLKNFGKFIIALPILAMFLFIALEATVVNASSGVFISQFDVSPYHAAKGARATASVTVQNLDSANAAFVTVTVSDGGVAVADNAQKPLSVPAGGSATVTFQFKTAMSPSHCYLATTSPLAYSTGYCESGSTLLGGTTLMVNSLAMIAPYAAITAGNLGVSVALLLRRRRN